MSNPNGLLSQKLCQVTYLYPGKDSAIFTRVAH